jgi:type II secretory pathway component PulJ
MKTFHTGKPVATVTQAAFAALQAGTEQAWASIRSRVSVPAAPSKAVDQTVAAQQQTLTQLSQAMTALRADLETLVVRRDTQALQARVDAAIAHVAQQVPDGRARLVTTAAMRDTATMLMDAVAKAPAGQTPSWFLDRFVARMSLEAAKAATLPARDALATAMATAPTQTWEAEIRKALTPDPKASEASELMDFLY